MNIDEMRAALREPAPVPLNVRLDTVVSRGRRRIAVRRAAAPVAVVAAAAMVAVPTVMFGGSGVDHPAVTASTDSAVATTPAASDSTRLVVPPSGSPIPRSAFGALISTGETVAGQQRVFRFEPVDGKLPGDPRFAVAVGFRQPDASMRVVMGKVERAGADDADGFHVLSIVHTTRPADDWTVFGYYAGPVAKVTARIDGRLVTARVAVWPGYPRVSVFWFTRGTGAPEPSANAAITDLRAYDAAGEALPSGPHARLRQS